MFPVQIVWPDVTTKFFRGKEMNQLNSIILEGNLVRDAVLFEPAEGFKVARFAIGVNRFYKNHNDEGVEEVSFFEVEAYGKIAEYSEKKAKKGRGIRVVGRLKQSSWKDDNNKYYSKVFVVAEHIEYKPIFQKKDEKKTENEQNDIVIPEQIPVTATAIENNAMAVEEALF